MMLSRTQRRHINMAVVQNKYSQVNVRASNDGGMIVYQGNITVVIEKDKVYEFVRAVKWASEQMQKEEKGKVGKLT